MAIRIERVSVSASGTQANDGSVVPTMSADGRMVAFVSSASNLVAGDTNGAYDTFVKDLVTGAVTRIVTGNYIQGVTPTLSADGNTLAFTSGSSNLVPGDNNGAADIFVKNFTTGTITRIGGGSREVGSSRPSLSADGHIVAFESSASDLVPGDRNDNVDVFVKDLTTGTIVRIEGYFKTSSAVLSADGHIVGYRSDMISSSGPQQFDSFYVKDLVNGTVTRIAAAVDISDSLSLSANGHIAAFDSYASDLVAGDTNGHADVFIKDLTSGTTTRIGGGNGDSYGGILSPDGHMIAFYSKASDLVSGDTNNVADLFVEDLTTGVVTRIGDNALQFNPVYFQNAIFSADGHSLVFASPGPELVAGDTNGATDIFIAHLPSTQTGTGGADTLTGYAGEDRLDGGAGDDTLYGRAGDDVLIGGPGSDTLYGGQGNDSYEVTDAGDVVIESAGEGNDIVYTSLYSFTLGSNVENLVLLNGAVIAVGNGLGNYLAGNDAANVLLGGSGSDIMVGGRGDDSYEVTDVGDIVFEFANQGAADKVYAYVDYTLPDNVENLIMAYGIQAYGFGNASDNIIIGNGSNNVIQGGAGYDTLTGGAGSDLFVVNPNWGVDAITDFKAGAGTEDAVIFSKSIFTSFAQVMANSAQVGADTYIGDGLGDTLVLQNVNRATLHPDDFGFF